MIHLDVYEHDHPDQKFVIIVRSDCDGEMRGGSLTAMKGRGLSVWWSKMEYAKSGAIGATISALTATSHVLAHTEKKDWVAKLAYKTASTFDEANSLRRSIGQDYVSRGFTFVGNPLNNLSKREAIALGINKPSSGRGLVRNKTRPELMDRIYLMTEYAPYELTDNEVKELVNRCHKPKVNDEILNISELFNAVCQVYIDNALNQVVQPVTTKVLVTV